jgi:hypothetical protein
MHTARRLLLSAGLLAVLMSAPLSAQNADYKPIPTEFDFPASEATLLAALAAGDEAKLRTHGWMVFAGLTQPARPGDPTSEAIWETWYSGEEAFGAGPAPQGVRPLHRKFSVPRQFGRPGTPHPQAMDESQLAFTLFNQETKDHTRQNRLHLFATLEAINQGWTSQTPIADRKVKDYPPAAMSLTPRRGTSWPWSRCTTRRKRFRIGYGRRSGGTTSQTRGSLPETGRPPRS